MPEFDPLHVLILVSVANLLGTFLLIHMLWPDRKRRLLPGVRPPLRHVPNHLMQALPEGHDWPDLPDGFDGLWETWICRCHLHQHKRKREGLTG